MKRHDDLPDDALMDSLLAKARTKEWKPIMDAHDAAAWILAQDILSNKPDTRDAAEDIAAALRRAEEDATKAAEAKAFAMAIGYIRSYAQAVHRDGDFNVAQTLDAVALSIREMAERARGTGGA